MDTTKITGPANTLDPQILRAWLAQPVDTDSDGAPVTLAAEKGWTTLSPSSTVDLTCTLDEVFQELLDDEEQDAWTISDEVEYINIRRTYGGNSNNGDHGVDGIDVHVDLKLGIRLCSMHRDHRQLTGGATDPIDVIVNAVTEVANQANLLVTEYHTKVGTRLTVNMAEALLDAVVTHAAAIDAGSRPWDDYDAGNSVLGVPDGYRDVLTAAGKVLRGITPEPF